MTDLVLTEDRKQYQELAHEFAQNEIAPKAHACDVSRKLPLEVIRKAWEIGLINVRLPEKFGGLGLGIFDASVIAEELGAGCAGISSAIWANDLAITPLLEFANQTQQQQLVEPLAQEFQLASYCFNGDKFLSGKHANNLTYEKAGDSYILSGHLTGINANHAKWTFAIANNKYNDAESTAFIIPLTSAGLKIGQSISSLGINCADLCELQFNAVSISHAQVLGQCGQGEHISRRSAALTGPVLASYFIGIARSALDNAVNYAKERHTMGQPIANHQAIAFLLADIAKDIQAARLMTYKAAWLADNGEIKLEAAIMCKSFAAEMAVKATIDAVQIYGGYGYSREYPVEKLMRDSKMLQLYLHNAQPIRMEIGKALVGSGL